MSNNPHTGSSTELATLAGGCFWCIEAVYRQVAGVKSVTSGYMGGKTPAPDYRSVCSGNTGHAEVVQITYDPDQVSYETLLAIFFTIHDPTQLNRQGNDTGTQYRSAIFPHDQSQHEIAEDLIAKLNDQHTNNGLPPIVTTLEPLDTFYPAEDYHQDYWANNPGNPYCNMLIPDKLAKMEKLLSSSVK